MEDICDVSYFSEVFFQSLYHQAYMSSAVW